MTLDNLNKLRKYLLACSYGPDSMSLFYLLLEGGYDFEVAHVNYGLRPEADKETEELMKFCEKHNVKIHVLYANVDPDKNMENECRLIRYRFFKELMEQNGYYSVLVAHQQDDVIETYLMQKKRKIYPKFYGIAEETRIFDVEIERPLLNYTKAELIKVCDDNNIPYAIDSSNLIEDHLRNQIRHQVVEKMSVEERQDILKHIKEDNKIVKSIDNILDYSDLESVEELLFFDEITYLYAINRSANEVQKDARISKKQAHEIKKILLSKKPNVEAKINGDLFFAKGYDRCHFYINGLKPISYSAEIKEPVKLDDEHFYIDLTGNTSNLNIDDDSYPITIRTAKPNDEVMINDYKVLVRRLFIDWKMPLDIRRQWPVITNKDGKVIYIPRYQKDFENDGKRNFYVKLK